MFLFLTTIVLISQVSDFKSPMPSGLISPLNPPFTQTIYHSLTPPRSTRPPHSRRLHLPRNNSHQNPLQPPPHLLPKRSPHRMARHSRITAPPLDIHHLRKARTHPLLPQHHQPRDRETGSPFLSLQLPIRVRRKPVPDRRASFYGEF
jgi:hypothetical protein